MCRVQADWFLLACGVIVTAACCIDGMQAADEVSPDFPEKNHFTDFFSKLPSSMKIQVSSFQVTNELHRLSNIPLADITDMSVAIIESIVSRQESTITASNTQI